MTKKDHILIANVLATTRNEPAFIDKLTINRIAYELAYTFKRDNPKFDRERFLEACGVPAT